MKCKFCPNIVSFYDMKKHLSLYHYIMTEMIDKSMEYFEEVKDHNIALTQNNHYSGNYGLSSNIISSVTYLSTSANLVNSPSSLTGNI